MKQYQFILLLLIIFSSNSIAQNTFEITISKPEDQVITKVIEDISENIVLVGSIKNQQDYGNSGYITKLDSTGNIINEIIITNDSISINVFDIHQVGFDYNLICSRKSNVTGIAKLGLIKLDNDFNILLDVSLNLSQNKWFSYINSIFDSDSNFVVTGYTTRLDTNHNGNTFYNNDAFFYKLNLSGDSLTSSFYTSDVPYHFSFDIIESWDSSVYYAFVSHFTDIFGTSGQRLTLDKDFNILNIDSIPLQVYDFYSPVYLNQNKILICGKRGLEPPNDYALNVLSITDSCAIIDYNTFKKNAFRDFPAMYNGVSKNGDNIYIGGTSNFDYSNPSYSTLDSWFHIIKTNPDITPIWEYWYGGDAYYHLYSILATNDGGCLMAGNRYDYETQDLERDIYIVKVDSNGLVTWTQEIPVNNQTATVYPNPGINQLNLKTEYKELNFELINLNGQVVISQMLDNNNKTINTESLKSGMYFYRLIDKKNKTIETGKWIKE